LALHSRALIPNLDAEIRAFQSPALSSPLRSSLAAPVSYRNQSRFPFVIRQSHIQRHQIAALPQVHACVGKSQATVVDGMRIADMKTRIPENAWS
jgi:hypothetical protein